ncbi:MAG: tRNA-dihydrouridine synthase [Patescibacteria group bacterium]
MRNIWDKLTKPIIALAPMAGITDSAFRQLCRQYGADVIYTEFISANALCHASAKTLTKLKFDHKEQPLICQLFGSDPKMLSGAAKIVTQLGFSGVDINFGCPAYKVVNHGGGVSLMRQPKLCRDLIEAVINSTKLPVSIKIRSSIGLLDDNGKKTNKSISALDLFKEIKDLPVSCIMIHARSYEQPFDGQPDTAMVKELRKIYSGVLLANGGVYAPADTRQLLKETNADGIGIARGCRGAPWFFKQIKDYLTTGKYQVMSFSDIKKVAIAHAELIVKNKGEASLREMRKHLAWYVRGVPGAAKLRSRLVRINSLSEIQSILDSASE